MAFTAEQNAALEAQGRVIVSASAGSGKTTVLVNRIAYLIKYDRYDRKNYPFDTGRYECKRNFSRYLHQKSGNANEGKAL